MTAAAPVRESESGVALLMVVWVLGLLAVIGVAVTADVRSELRLARNRVDVAQARALAEGGVWWAVERLTSAQARETLRIDGTPATVTLGDREVQVAIQDERGKLDINAAPAAMLERLLAAIGVDAGEAEQLAQAIDAHRRACRARRPADDPFAAVEEIRHIPGMGPELYARAAKYLTVATGEARINPATAPREVLDAVPGMTRSLLETYLANRKPGMRTTVGPELPPVELLDYLTWRVADAVTVRAVARGTGGAAYHREALVALTGDDRQYRVLAWRQGFDAAEPD